MKNKLMVGFWRLFLQLPPSLWEKRMAGARKRMMRESGELTDEQRRVHHQVVRMLPQVGEPLSMQAIAEAVELDEDRVRAVIDDLERRMTFLFRNEAGEVTWAYPVTVDNTPHQLTFSTGERLNAA